MTKRLGAAIAAAAVLFVMAMPAAAACCLVTPDGAAASMHASMPCCNESCTMSSPTGDREHDVAIAAGPSPEAGAQTGPGVAVAFPATAATITTVSTAAERTRIDFSAPPPFLAHAQFRI
jgi:hypothetical protein